MAGRNGKSGNEAASTVTAVREEKEKEKPVRLWKEEKKKRIRGVSGESEWYIELNFFFILHEALPKRPKTDRKSKKPYELRSGSFPCQ